MEEYQKDRTLSGIGEFSGPALDTQAYEVFEFLKAHLSKFAESFPSKKIKNEKAMNGRLARFITNAANHKDFFAELDHMEDETRGNSPATDIGIYRKIDDSENDPPIITTIEGQGWRKNASANM